MRQTALSYMRMRKSEWGFLLVLQVSSSLSCPLRCVPPARIVVNAAVRRLIQRLRISPAGLKQQGPPPMQQAPAGKPPV